MAEPEPSLIADRYRLGEPLGRGGMGVVWRARDEFLHRDVAIKEVTLRFGLASAAEQSIQRTLREARAAARLNHPGIVSVYDVVIHDDRPLIVMELVEGRSLAQVVREDGVLSPWRAAEVGRQVLHALDVAHRNGILHRDIKPANILLTGDRVVLTDFGIAAVAGATTLTDTSTLIGSPDYLAPERVNGRPATPASDRWALGVTLCAALRGESPFQREDTQATLAAVLTAEPTPIVGAGWLWPVIAGLLHKDPAERLTTGQAVERLTELLAAEPATEHLPARTGPVGSVDPVAPPVRRWVPALLVVSLVAALAVVWLVLPERTVAGGPVGVPATAPPGFRVHEDAAGFTVAVPRQWRAEAFEQEVFWASEDDPRRTLWAHVEWRAAEPGASAARSLLEFERAELEVGSVTEYRQLSLTEVAAGGGQSAAELECTYRYVADGDFYAHDLMRTVITRDGWRYTLTLAAQTTRSAAATETLWRENVGQLRMILASFVVTR